MIRFRKHQIQIIKTRRRQTVLMKTEESLKEENTKIKDNLEQNKEIVTALKEKNII